MGDPDRSLHYQIPNDQNSSAAQERCITPYHGKSQYGLQFCYSSPVLFRLINSHLLLLRTNYVLHRYVPIMVPKFVSLAACVWLFLSVCSAIGCLTQVVKQQSVLLDEENLVQIVSDEIEHRREVEKHSTLFSCHTGMKNSIQTRIQYIWPDVTYSPSQRRAINGFLKQDLSE